MGGRTPCWRTVEKPEVLPIDAFRGEEASGRFQFLWISFYISCVLASGLIHAFLVSHRR